jgi:putative component of membrane protein insertase Oxa1/YidC/SpoIIIJ protein YidD
MFTPLLTNTIQLKLTVHLTSYLTFLLLPLLLSTAAIEADPWGTDAEMAIPIQSSATRLTSSHSPSASKNKLSLPQRTLKAIIRFHQDVLSPVDGPRSHFVPSSSQYMWTSIKEYGAFQGWIMGCDRLLRENSDPWVYPLVPAKWDSFVKSDPVPPRRPPSK